MKTLRNVSVYLLVAAAIFVVLAILAPVERKTSTPEATVVTAVHRKAVGFVSGVSGDIVTVETEDGHIWDFYGDGYTVGDFVEVVFDTNGTFDDVVDDAILQVDHI